jgi:hypothetical protein
MVVVEKIEGQNSRQAEEAPLPGNWINLQV